VLHLTRQLPTITSLAGTGSRCYPKASGVKARFVQHRSRLGPSACPMAGTGRYTPSFFAVSPAPSLLGRFAEILPQVPGPHAFGHTPRRDVSATAQRLFSDRAAPLVRYVPREAYRMQPSYCFRGATATRRFSDPLRNHTFVQRPPHAFNTRPGIGFRACLWSFGTRHYWWCSRPRSNVPFTCTRAFVLAASYSRTTLAVLVRQSARRLGMQPPISSMQPFMAHCFHNGDYRLSPRAFGIA
jgi:hypothetical protein